MRLPSIRRWRKRSTAWECSNRIKAHGRQAYPLWNGQSRSNLILRRPTIGSRLPIGAPAAKRKGRRRWSSRKSMRNSRRRISTNGFGKSRHSSSTAKIDRSRHPGESTQEAGARVSLTEEPEAAEFMRAKSERLAAPQVLPAAGLQKLRLFEGGCGQTLHRARNLLADFGENLRVFIVGRCDDDGFGARYGLLAFFHVVFDVERRSALFHEDSRADEDGFCAQLHHERGVGGSGDAAGGKVWHGELAGLGDHAHQLVRRL